MGLNAEVPDPGARVQRRYGGPERSLSDRPRPRGRMAGNGPRTRGSRLAEPRCAGCASPIADRLAGERPRSGRSPAAEPQATGLQSAGRAHTGRRSTGARALGRGVHRAQAPGPQPRRARSTRGMSGVGEPPNPGVRAPPHRSIGGAARLGLQSTTPRAGGRRPGAGPSSCSTAASEPPLPYLRRAAHKAAPARRSAR
jgi:hypothetical protein